MTLCGHRVFAYVISYNEVTLGLRGPEIHDGVLTRRGEGTETQRKEGHGPSQLAQLVRESSQYAKVVGSIPGQGTYKKQLMFLSL